MKVQIRNPRKVYAIDLGLFTENSHSFSKESGRRLENAVYLYLKTKTKEIYYFQEKKECDFVVFNNGVIKAAIQVTLKIELQNQKKEVDGLLEAMNFFDLNEGYILTLDQKDKFLINNKTINVIPAWEYFLQKPF